MKVGICRIRQAQDNKFKEQIWRKTGHGHYCVSFDELVFSHHEDDINCKFSWFKFRSGIVLHFEYDSTRGILRIRKNNGEKYVMSIDKGADEKYAFCAYLSESGDSVELIHA